MDKETKKFILESLDAVETRLGKNIAAIKESVKSDIVNSLGSRLTGIEKKLADIEHAQQFQADQYESFRKQIGTLLRENTELKNENVLLATRIRNLEKKDEQLVKELDDLEQYGRREMLEIGGIPRETQENCEDIVIAVAQKVGVALNSQDIEACHRTSRKSDAPIIVKVVSRKKKEEFMSKETKSKAKKLRISDLGFTLNPTAADPNKGKVFINESLTSRKKIYSA